MKRVFSAIGYAIKILIKQFINHFLISQVVLSRNGLRGSPGIFQALISGQLHPFGFKTINNYSKGISITLRIIFKGLNSDLKVMQFV